MSGRGSRLKPIADQAGMDETDAARRLAAAARVLKDKETTLEHLRGYLAEYRRRAAQDEVSTDAARWHNARAFLTKLTDAVAFHEGELKRAQAAYRLQTEQWRESHRRARALEGVIEQARRDARLDAEKRNQTELDELAMRQRLYPRR